MKRTSAKETMPSPIKLSILVTFYNQEQFVDQTLENILGMELPERTEIVLGDDGSSDGTLLKIQKWAESHPSLIRFHTMPRDPNQKYDSIVRAAENRVQLLKESKGDYIAFLDGDDFYCDTRKFIKQVEVLDRRPDLAASCSNCCLYYGENDERNTELNDLPHDCVWTAKEYWMYHYCHPSTFVFRNYYLSHELDFPTLFFDDNFIAFVFLRFGGVHYLGSPTSCYRIGEGTLWTGKEIEERSFVNLLDYEAERLVAPQLEKVSRFRHYRDFIRFDMTRLNELKQKYRLKISALGNDNFRWKKSLTLIIKRKSLLAWKKISRK